MARRLTPSSPHEVAAALAAYDDGTADRDTTRQLVKHYLAVLCEVAPGASVEIRVPPFAAVQCIPGVRHTRGTPPAVIETDADTWIAVACGRLGWAEAVEGGRVLASGERTDLSGLLPLQRD